MSLKGAFAGFEGGGAGGAFLGNLTEEFGEELCNDLRRAIWMTASGPFCRSVPIGGSLTRGLIGSTVVDAIDAVDFEIDNTSGYLTSSSGLTVPITVWCRVENAGISVTPQIYNVTDASVAETGSACAATAVDFSGTNSKQTLTLTPASGVKLYRLRFTPSAATYQFWGMGWRSLYI